MKKLLVLSCLLVFIAESQAQKTVTILKGTEIYPKGSQRHIHLLPGFFSNDRFGILRKPEEPKPFTLFTSTDNQYKPRLSYNRISVYRKHKMYIVDNNEVEEVDFNKINPDEIESMNLIKNNENDPGMVVITCKKK